MRDFVNPQLQHAGVISSVRAGGETRALLRDLGGANRQRRIGPVVAHVSCDRGDLRVVELPSKGRHAGDVGSSLVATLRAPRRTRRRSELGLSERAVDESANEGKSRATPLPSIWWHAAHWSRQRPPPSARWCRATRRLVGMSGLTLEKSRDCRGIAVGHAGRGMHHLPLPDIVHLLNGCV
jgi:hypothetical protein